MMSVHLYYSQSICHVPLVVANSTFNRENIKNVSELPHRFFLTLQEITFAIFGGFLCMRSQNWGFEVHALSTENVHRSTIAFWGWFRMTAHQHTTILTSHIFSQLENYTSYIACLLRATAHSKLCTDTQKANSCQCYVLE